MQPPTCFVNEVAVGTVSCLCRPEVNQRISKAAHIKELNTEIDKLKEELFATREKNGVYLPADHWESQQVPCQHLPLIRFIWKHMQCRCTARCIMP